MNYTLTEARKKMLTEFIGECWHELKRQEDGVDGHKICSCGNWYYISCIENRPFDAPDDRQALAEKLMEMGEWNEFLLFAASKFNPDKEMKHFAYWFLVERPDRFSWLVAEFLEVKK